MPERRVLEDGPGEPRTGQVDRVERDSAEVCAAEVQPSKVAGILRAHEPGAREVETSEIQPGRLGILDPDPDVVQTGLAEILCEQTKLHERTSQVGAGEVDPTPVVAA